MSNTAKVGLGVRARSPEYLIAKVEATEARKAVKGAKTRLEWMTSENERHAEQVTTATRHDADAEMVTSTQAQTFTGGRMVVVYSRCEVDGHTCRHDAGESPHSPESLHAAGAEISKAERKLTKAEKALAAAEANSSFDVAEAVRDGGGPPFAHWPLEAYPDPRKRNYQGKPLTADEVRLLGPLELQRQLADGTVIEVRV